MIEQKATKWEFNLLIKLVQERLSSEEEITNGQIVDIVKSEILKAMQDVIAEIDDTDWIGDESTEYIKDKVINSILGSRGIKECI